MRNTSFRTLIIVVCCGVRLQAADVSFNIAASPGYEGQSAFVRFSIELKGTNRDDWGKTLLAKFEQQRANMTIDEKLDVLKWYLFKLRFLDAERLGEQLVAESGANDGRILFSMGVVRVCRGDYDGACHWLRGAEEAGFRLAAHVRAYIACGILEQSDAEREYIMKLIKNGEMNSSPVALAAVLAFAMSAKSGREAFDMVTTQVDYSKLAKSSSSLTDVYIHLCKKYGKSDELKRIERLLEQRR